MTERAQDQKGPTVTVQKAPKRTTSKAREAKQAAEKKSAKPTLSDTAKKRLEQLTSEIAKLEELKSEQVAIMRKEAVTEIAPPAGYSTASARQLLTSKSTTTTRWGLRTPREQPRRTNGKQFWTPKSASFSRRASAHHGLPDLCGARHVRREGAEAAHGVAPVAPRSRRGAVAEMKKDEQRLRLADDSGEWLGCWRHASRSPSGLCPFCAEEDPFSWFE